MVRSAALRLVIALGCLAAAAGGQAQGFPAKPVRFVVPFGAGSGTDTIARILAGGMTQAFGQQVIVENRAGAAGNIGAELVAKAAPDGYTMLLVNLGHAANVSIYRTLPYDLMRDLTAVTYLAYIPQLLVVHPSLPAKSVAELVKLAKSRPGKVDYGSGGVGTPSYVTGELFKARTGIDLMHVPYKSGAEALTAVVTGEAPIFFAPASTTLPLIQQGRLRGLAITSAQRVSVAAGIPTVAESGFPGFQAGNWYGIMVPAKVPADVIGAIHKAAVAALANPAVRKRLDELGFVIVGDGPAQFSTFVRAEIADLAKVLKGLQLAQ